MWTEAFLLLTFTFFCGGVSRSESQTVVLRDGQPKCSLTETQLKENIRLCEDLMGNFVQRFLRSIRTRNHRNRKRARSSKNFKICSSFHVVQNCVKKLHHTGCGVADVTSQLQEVAEVIEGRCSNVKEHEATIGCFSEQYASTLSRGCDSEYRTYRQHRSLPRCEIVHYSIQCKQALITTACDSEAAKFAETILHYHEKSRLNRAHCEKTATLPYSGFRYDGACGKNLAPLIHNCYSQFIDKNRLPFNAENELIADANADDVNQACGKLRGFQRCTKTLRDTCPKGVDLILRQDGELRTYLMRMEYICQHAVKTKYIKALPCYKDSLQGDTLGGCEKVWKKMSPIMNRVNAYQFYCQPRSNVTLRLKTHLKQLRVCYENGYKLLCENEDSIEIMSQLIKKAFRDPFYLNYIYKPTCAVQPHVTTSPSTTVISTTSRIADKRTASQNQRGERQLVAQNTDKVWQKLSATSSNSSPSNRWSLCSMLSLLTLVWCLR